MIYSPRAASLTPKLWPLHRAAAANHYIEIKCGRSHGDGSCVIGGLDRQMFIIYVISLWKAIFVRILLRVILFEISVSKLWDTMIDLGMYMCQRHLTNVLLPKSCCKTANKLELSLPITLKWEFESNIIDQMNEQNWSEWCHTSHSRSGQCKLQICLNYIHYSFIHLCIRLPHCLHGPSVHGWDIEHWVRYVMENEDKELDETIWVCWAIFIKISHHNLYAIYSWPNGHQCDKARWSFTPMTWIKGDEQLRW